ncbi:uncharacterized protein TNCV_2031511 [Trichonephila clavipes]|nr:uncharacterized protein TNCV_2031511 [Trichonephila clavipes]
MQCLERQRMDATERINDGASTSAARAVEIMQIEDEIASTAASARFTTTFVNNPFGHEIVIGSDRLWFLRSLKPTTTKKHLPLLHIFPEELIAKLYATCKNSLYSDKVSTSSPSNGFVYPPKHGLVVLDLISARLVSPRLSFMQIRWLQRH